MKKVGIITFHAAHNYGSNLQAYSLQRVISKLGCDCEIINFRTERQKDQYRPLTKRKRLKYIIKNSYFLLNYKSRKQKYDNFESFINSNLVVSSNEYNSLDSLTAAVPQYDYYVSGSDQIWNTVPNDADDAYFLPFVKSGKRISYAPSFGQWGNIKHKEKIAKYLSEYDVISVRESFGKDLVCELTGRDVPIVPDPTLLTEKQEWEKLVPEKIVSGEYIFFYTLFATKEMIDVVKCISKAMGVPVVISNISNQYEIFSGFKKIRYAGPLEFLSLLYHAKFVCATSFHGTVFSLIFNKPFFCINGMDDNRINTLLTMTEMTDRSVTKNDVLQKTENAFDIDFKKSNEKLETLRKIGEDFLIDALDLEETNGADM